MEHQVVFLTSWTGLVSALAIMSSGLEGKELPTQRPVFAKITQLRVRPFAHHDYLVVINLRSVGQQSKS